MWTGCKSRCLTPGPALCLPDPAVLPSVCAAPGRREGPRCPGSHLPSYPGGRQDRRELMGASCVMTGLASDLTPSADLPGPGSLSYTPGQLGNQSGTATMKACWGTDGNRPQPYPMTARALLMDGEEGGVAVASRLRPELEGGDVEGTVRLTTGASSPSPVGGQTRSARGNCPDQSWPQPAPPPPWGSNPVAQALPWPGTPSSSPFGLPD